MLLDFQCVTDIIMASIPPLILFLSLWQYGSSMPGGVSLTWPSGLIVCLAGRMSVIARAPDGSIRLYCKGADNVLLPRLRKGSSAAMLQATHENLRLYSIQVAPMRISYPFLLGHPELFVHLKSTACPEATVHMT